MLIPRIAAIAGILLFGILSAAADEPSALVTKGPVAKAPVAKGPVAKGLAETPPLGWNSFQSYGIYLHEKAALENVEAMAAKFKPHGYQYFVIDSGWFGEFKLRPGTLYSAEKHASDLHINEFGLLQPSKCYFPNGLKPVIDRCHALGLKFGLHLMRGIPRKAVVLNTRIEGTSLHARDIADVKSTCVWCPYNYGVDMTKPGAQVFYDSLIRQMASWGVDFIKADDIVPYPAEIEAVAGAIQRCGRPIVLSLSPGGKVDPKNLAAFRAGNMLRVTPDVWDDAEGIDRCFAAWRKWQGCQRPNFWIDMDMIPFGQLQLMSPDSSNTAGQNAIGQNGVEVQLAGKGHRRACQLNRDQMITFITMRALAASPLMIGGDLPTMDVFSLRLLTNDDMLGCNQNGEMASLVSDKYHLEVWRTLRKDNPEVGWVGVFNRGISAQSFTVTAANLGLKPRAGWRARNIWAGGEQSLDGDPVSIPPGGVLFLAVSAPKEG